MSATTTLPLSEEETQRSGVLLGRRWRRAVPVLLSVGGLLVIWLLASFLTPLVPSPMSVIEQLFADASYYPVNIAVTMSSAAQGYLWGNGIAIALALLTLPFPPLQALLERIAVGAIALPLIAVAPILAIAFAGNIPSVILAAQAVVFTTLVSCILGLSNVDQSALDLVHSAGGSKWTAIWKVRLPAAIPSFVVGLQIAAPSAILGAIIGEYMGGSRGLGVAMIQAQGAFDIPRAWALAIVTSALAAIAFLVIPWIVKLTMPWVGQTSSNISPRALSRRRRLPWPLATLRTLTSVAGTIVVVFAVWWLMAKIVPGGQAVARGPFEVVAYLSDPELLSVSPTGQSQTAWESMLTALGQTAIDAGVGFVAGTVLSVLMAVVVYESRTVEALIMPVSIVLRSVPIVAAMPLLALLFGRGILAVTVLITLMTFFPTLVNLLLAMRSAPTGAVDLFTASGASRWQRLSKLLLPYALPALFASIKIALPLSVGAAMVAEWLATGSGLGAAMTVAATMSDYYFVWGGVAAVLLISLLLYQLASYGERKISARLA
ncbi:ABC transporter permease subunit [Microbacterium sp.]|uniref:ABC transporter permease n=1 Tax=Microbacterium sp. TaxID=51671 RepID=UPI00281282CF|nr:ABC transporter permease subunit [Microbacterium sp.]